MRTASNPVIVIGASHAAVQLGVSLRQEGYRGDIILIGQEKHPPYNRPPLSKTLLTQQVDFERTIDVAPSWRISRSRTLARAGGRR